MILFITMNWKVNMQIIDDIYMDLVNKIIAKGEIKKCRNGKTKSIFGAMLKTNNLYLEFPILRSRKIYFEGLLGEMKMFFGLEEFSKENFNKEGCKFWDSWADQDGNIDIDYGIKWRSFRGVDQLKELLKNLIVEPFSRRHILTGWDPASTPALPCCHLLYQFSVDKDMTLHMTWYQRSADVMLGLPSDLVSAGLMLRAIAKLTELKPGSITIFLGDAHIYEKHEENLATLQKAYLKLKNQARIELPRVKIYEDEFFTSTPDNIFNDVALHNYKPLEPIKFELIT